MKRAAVKVGELVIYKIRNGRYSLWRKTCGGNTMDKSFRKTLLSLQGFYLLAFFGFGSLFPLLSVYLSQVHQLNGVQIGTIMSVGPIIFIFFQPLWGMFSDYSGAPRYVLSATSLLAGIMALGYLLLESYTGLLFVAIFVAVFQSAIVPVSDSISVKFSSNYRYDYGNIRLFGSLGFGLAVFIVGKLSEGSIGPNIIFYAFFVCLVLSAFISLRFPKETVVKNLKLKEGFQELVKLKKFIIFLIITFSIFGPNLANNTYFGLFVEDSGGTYAGIGIAFFVAVMAEIPFMRWSGAWIKKIGLLHVTIIAGVASLIRWAFYFTEPSLMLVYVSSVIQGISIGFFVPAGIQYIRKITPNHLTATAITLYSAIGNGLGNWFHTFVGGIVMEQYSIYTVYLFFALLTSLGIILSVYLVKGEKREVLMYAKNN